MKKLLRAGAIAASFILSVVLCSCGGGGGGGTAGTSADGPGATLTAITLTPGDSRIACGTSCQLTATGTYTDGTTATLTAFVTWQSENREVVTVNNEGLATSAATGTVTITATTGGISGSATLTVTPATLLSIAITPANPGIATGTTQQFTASGTFSDNTAQDLTASATWSSSATSVATVSNVGSARGLATATAAGTSTISAAFGSISGSTTLAVAALSAAPQPPSGVSTAVANGNVTISYNASPGASFYNIYWSNTPGVTKATGRKIAGLTGMPYTLTGLTNGTTYYYVVTAANDYGESSESSEVLATPNSITATIVAPSRGGFADDNTLNITVTAASTYQMAGITARVADRQTSLVYSNTAVCGDSSYCGGWTGTISLSGLPRGAKNLTATATDVYGNSATASTSFVYDLPPTLVITEPMNDTVARPQLHVSASCTDDDPEGCTLLSVIDNHSGAVLASGQKRVDQNVSLVAYEGKSATIRFEAKDSAGQVRSASRTVFVESSARLVDVASVPGRIWDVQPDRILFLDTSGGGNILKIRDRSSGQDTVVMNKAGEIPHSGFLTPKGAIFEAENSDNVVIVHLYDWRDGTLVDTGFLVSSYSLKVKGNYAIWNIGQRLMRRDLVSGLNTTITDIAITTLVAGISEDDVAANGDVVYWGPSSNVFRYRNGVASQLTNDNTFSHRSPLTDGVNVIYKKKSSADQMHQLALYTASGEETLTPAGTQDFWSNGDFYQLNNGWAAFTKPETGGVLQIWLRSPVGALRQVSFLGTSSLLETLSPQGDVIWISGNRRYLSVSGAPPVDVGSAFGTTSLWGITTPGKSFYQDGQWYVTLGGSLFRIAP